MVDNNTEEHGERRIVKKKLKWNEMSEVVIVKAPSVVPRSL